MYTYFFIGFIFTVHVCVCVTSLWWEFDFMILLCLFCWGLDAGHQGVKRAWWRRHPPPKGFTFDNKDSIMNLYENWTKEAIFVDPLREKQYRLAIKIENQLIIKCIQSWQSMMNEVLAFNCDLMILIPRFFEAAASSPRTPFEEWQVRTSSCMYPQGA